MRRSSFVTPAVWALAVLFAVGCAGSKSRLKVGKTADGEVVEAEGLAPNQPNDVVGTKRASLADAQKNAVEKAVGVFVSARTMVEKAVAIENNILAKTEGYVKKYDILSEGVDNGMYKTRIRALVAVKDLEADLRSNSLLDTPQLQRPRIALRLTEEVDNAPLENDDTASTVVAKILREKGFVIVDGDKASESDVTVSGKTSAFPFQQEGLGGFVSYRARLSLKAVRSGTSDVVGSFTKEASGLGGNSQLAALKAIETVGELAANELSEKLPQALSGGGNAIVFVESVPTFGDVEKVRKHLASQPGIVDLTLRSYDEGMAQFEIQLKGSSLAEIASHLDTSKTLPLKVTESKGQTLHLKYGG